MTLIDRPRDNNLFSNMDDQENLYVILRYDFSELPIKKTRSEFQSPDIRFPSRCLLTVVDKQPRMSR